MIKDFNEIKYWFYKGYSIRKNVYLTRKKKVIF